MPASDTYQDRRGGQLPTGLLWTGVGLAPVAAALVLLGGGAGALRVAAVIAILAVVLIGLSITLRPDARSMRAELEDALLDELDALRDEIRKELSQGSRGNQRALVERMQQLAETVEALRGQVDALRVGMPPAVGPVEPEPVRANGISQQAPAGNPMVAGGVVRHTETVQVTTRHTVVDQHDADRAGGYRPGGKVYGAASPAEPGYRTPRPPEPAYGAARPAEPGYGGRSDAGYGANGRAEVVYGVARPEPAPQPRGEWGEPRQREAEQEPRRRDFGSGEYRRPRPYERDDRHVDEPATDTGWGGVQAGDRWAEVRADERGREVRMGERRAAVHHDDAGTAMRIEDRWAEVREADPATWRRANGRPETRGERRAREGWSDEAAYGGDSGSWSTPSWGTGVPVVGRAGLPALPAPDPTPASGWSGTGGWRAVPEREAEPRRRRAEEAPEDRWGTGSMPRVRDTGSMPRVRPDYDLPEDRWR